MPRAPPRLAALTLALAGQAWRVRIPVSVGRRPQQLVLGAVLPRGRHLRQSSRSVAASWFSGRLTFKYENPGVQRDDPARRGDRNILTSRQHLRFSLFGPHCHLRQVRTLTKRSKGGGLLVFRMSRTVAGAASSPYSAAFCFASTWMRAPAGKAKKTGTHKFGLGRRLGRPWVKRCRVHRRVLVPGLPQAQPSMLPAVG